MSTAAPALSLKSLLVPSKTVEVDYPGLNGFKVNVVFLSREKLVEKAKGRVRNYAADLQNVADEEDDFTDHDREIEPR